jgi:hypothetical protein
MREITQLLTRLIILNWTRNRSFQIKFVNAEDIDVLSFTKMFFKPAITIIKTIIYEYIRPVTSISNTVFERKSNKLYFCTTVKKTVLYFTIFLSG